MYKHLEKTLKIKNINEYSSINDGQSESAYIKTENLTNQISFIKTFQNEDKVFESVLDAYKSDELCSLANVATVEKVDYTANVISVVFEAIKGKPLSNYDFIEQLTLSQSIYIVNQIVIYLKQTHKLSFLSHTLRPDHIFYDTVSNVVTIIPVLKRYDINTSIRIIESVENALYLSPEELEETSCHIDWRSDYYKLGLIFYELIIKRKLLNTEEVSMDEVKLFHQKDKEYVEIKYVDIIIKETLSRLTKSEINKRFCTDDELLEVLSYIGYCISDSAHNCQKTYLHNINSSIYPRYLYSDTFNNLSDIYENNLSDIVISSYSGYGKSVFINSLEMGCLSLNCLLYKGAFDGRKISQPFIVIKHFLLSFKENFSNESIINSFMYIKNEVDKYAFNSVFYLCRDIFDLSYFDDVVEGVSASEGVYKALLMFIEHLTNKQHVFLVVENVQWCDKESYELIVYLLDNRSTFIHFVFSYRINELVDNAYGSKIIEKCLLDDNVLYKNIKGFSDDECCDYIGNYIGLKFGDDYLKNINRRAQGNPFFIKQMLIALYMEGLDLGNLDEMALNGLAGEYKGLEYYVELNVGSVSEKSFQLLKYMACYGRSISKDLLSVFLSSDMPGISEILMECVNAGCVFEKHEVVSFSNEKIREAIYSKIDVDEQRLIHKNISYSLQADISNENLFESVIQLNLAKSILNDNESLGAVKINVDAAKYSLDHLSYSTANLFYTNALDYVDAHKNELEEKFVESIRYGSIYTSFLSGKSSRVIDDLELLLNASKKLEEAAKYYALYKDIVVSENKDYNSAVTKGVELLSNFGFSLPSSEAGIDELKRSVESIDLAEIASNMLDGTSGFVDERDSDKGQQIRILIDLWEAAYYAQNLDLMELTIYKILEISVKGHLYSESSFGFVMYSMYLSKNGMNELAYESGLLALRIVDRYDDKIMFPKITNLFCNYTAFNAENFSDISVRYYSSYKASISTSDFLFGAWASYFFVWTRFLSGDSLQNVLKDSKEVFSFLYSTNDKKMLMSYLIVLDAIDVLAYGAKVNLKDENKLCGFDEDSFDYFSDIVFSPGVAWQAIINIITNFIYGNFQVVIDVIDKHLLDKNIDIVMFPITQVPFYESLSLLQLLKSHNNNDEEYQEVLDRLKISVCALSDLSKNKSTNFYTQFCVVKISLLLNGLDFIHIKQNLDQLVERVTSEGSFLEKGVLFEILAQEACLNSEYSVATNYVTRSIDEFTQWGSKLKVKQLLHDYASVLNFKNECYLDSNNNYKWGGNFNKLLKTSAAISGALDFTSVIRMAVESVYSESSANKIYFLSCLNDGIEISCSCIDGKLNENLNQDIDQGDGFILNSLVYYCFGTQKSVYIDGSESCSPFMKEVYVIDNSIKSIICVPIIYRQRVLAIVYLENSKRNVPFSLEVFYFIKMMLVQVSVSLVNSNLYISLKNNIDKQIASSKELAVKIDKMNYVHKYSSVGVWDWDIVSGDLEWSDEIFNIFGCSKLDTDINYDNFMKLIHPDDREIVKTAVNACIEGDDYNVEHRVLRPDGSILWVSETGNIIRDLENKPLRMFGIMQDISASKEIDIKNIELNRQLNQSRKMESIGHLTGGIAHDFNNILASMLGYTELAQMKVASIEDAKISEYLDNVYLAGQRAKDLVSQMMLFSRTHTDHYEPVSLAPLVTESVKMLTSTIPSSIKITTLLSNNLPDVVIDPIQAQQILINICVNSRDAIQGIGEIKISLQSTHISSVCSSCHDKFNGDFISLIIEDNGCGIEEQALGNIFEPFFTTKEVGKGTGMGMSVVHGIVHSHNGHILISSSHHGTKITILLPVSEKKSTNESLKLVQGITRSKVNKSIVVVDDEDLILEFVSELLKTSGAHVVTFNKPTDALDYMLKNINEVDLMITDMTMPVMSGTTLSKKIFEVQADFPVILCTGQSFVVDEKKARDIGIAGYLTKPYSSNKLINMIVKLLE